MGLREEPLISQHAANAASARAPLAYRSTRRRAGRLRDRVGRNEARATVVGVSAGAFIVAAVTSGSTLLMLLALGVAISVSVISPLAGLIALALAAPLARTLVIPAPGLYVAMAGAMFLGLVLRLPLQRSQPRLPSAAVVLLGAFLLYAGVHLVAGRLDGAPGLRTTELASLFARVTECVLAFGLASVILRGRTPYPVLGALLASAVIAGFLGLAQLTGMDASFSDLMEPPGESGRITSVFSNPNYYGAYLASMTVLAVALLSVVASRRARTALLVAAAFLFLVLLFTQSRGGLATLLAGLMAIAFVHSRRAGLPGGCWTGVRGTAGLSGLLGVEVRGRRPRRRRQRGDSWRTDRRLDVRVRVRSSRLPCSASAWAGSRTLLAASPPTTGSCRYWRSWVSLAS